MIQEPSDWMPLDTNKTDPRVPQLTERTISRYFARTGANTTRLKRNSDRRYIQNPKISIGAQAQTTEGVPYRLGVLTGVVSKSIPGMEGSEREKRAGGGHDGRVVMAELVILGGTKSRGGAVAAIRSVSCLLPRKYIVRDGEGDKQAYRVNVPPSHKFRPCRGDVCLHARALLSYLRSEGPGSTDTLRTWLRVRRAGARTHDKDQPVENLPLSEVSMEVEQPVLPLDDCLEEEEQEAEYSDTPDMETVKRRLRGVGGRSNAQLFPSHLLPEMRLGAVASATYKPAAEEYLRIRKDELDTLAAEGLFSVRDTVGLPLKMDSLFNPVEGCDCVWDGGGQTFAVCQLCKSLDVRLSGG